MLILRLRSKPSSTFPYIALCYISFKDTSIILPLKKGFGDLMRFADLKDIVETAKDKYLNDGLELTRLQNKLKVLCPHDKQNLKLYYKKFYICSDCESVIPLELHKPHVKEQFGL